MPGRDEHLCCSVSHVSCLCKGLILAGLHFIEVVVCCIRAACAVMISVLWSVQ